MSQLATEIEGTWEEVSARGREFTGRRVRLTLLDSQIDATDEVVIPRRPKPTPEQAALGILPAINGTGSFEDVMALVDTLSTSGEPTDDLWATIAENRAERRASATRKCYDLFLERDL
jgi:hypothetical protein